MTLRVLKALLWAASSLPAEASRREAASAPRLISFSASSSACQHPLSLQAAPVTMLLRRNARVQSCFSLCNAIGFPSTNGIICDADAKEDWVQQT